MITPFIQKVEIIPLGQDHLGLDDLVPSIHFLFTSCIYNNTQTNQAGTQLLIIHLKRSFYRPIVNLLQPSIVRVRLRYIVTTKGDACSFPRHNCTHSKREVWLLSDTVSSVKASKLTNYLDHSLCRHQAFSVFRKEEMRIIEEQNNFQQNSSFYVVLLEV